MGFGFRVSRLGDGKAQLDRLGAHPQAAREQLGALPLRLATMASSSAERAACVSEPCCRRAVPRGRGRARVPRSTMSAEMGAMPQRRHWQRWRTSAMSVRVPIRGHPRSAEAIRGHQRPSEVIRAYQVGGERRVAVARLVIMVAEVLVTVGKAVVRAAVVAALHNVDREPPSAPCGTSFRLTASATASANPAPRTAVAPRSCGRRGAQAAPPFRTPRLGSTDGEMSGTWAGCGTSSRHRLRSRRSSASRHEPDEGGHQHAMREAISMQAFIGLPTRTVDTLFAR